MKLDEFVSETLKSIIKGVSDAQEFAKEKGSKVNPLRTNQPLGRGISLKYGRSMPVTPIEFDVAVTAATKQESGVGGGITVLSFNVGGKTSDIDTNQTVSRIKFNVEITLPVDITLYDLDLSVYHNL